MSRLKVKPLLVLLLLLLSPSGAKAQLRQVEVAVLLELEGNFNVNAEARLVAVHLALECIRSGSTKHCPACAEIRNRQTQLVLRQWDAGTTKQSAVEAAVAIMATYPNITGFIGPQYSGISEAVADRVLIPGNGLDPLAVVSPSATNPALSEKPNFFRTAPSDVSVCRAIMQVAVKLGYRAIAGVVEASGGWPQGINRKMLELSSEFDVQYTPIQFSGTDFAADLTEDLSRQNPAVILGVGKDTEDTYLLFQLLYNLRAGGVLACRLLMGGDLIAGGGAPRFKNNTDDVKYFAGVVSFKASGSGERLELWKTDWPTMVGELDLDTILTTEDSVQHQIAREHLEAPPSYCPEIFEATILFALAAALHPDLPMTSAIRLLPLGGFDCLDQQPVKLDQSGDRIGNLVSIFQHRRVGVFVPDVIGEWSLTDSAVRLDPQSALDDLASNPVVVTTTTPPVKPMEWLPWIICIVIVLLFVAVLGFICKCPDRLPHCLQRCLPAHLQPSEPPTPVGGSGGDGEDGGERGTGGGTGGGGTGEGTGGGGTEGGTQPVPDAIPPSPSSQVAPPPPTKKTPGFLSTAILGGDLSALLLTIVRGILALRAHKAIEVRLVTSIIKEERGYLRFVQDREKQVQTVHDHSLNLFAKISELADCFVQKDDSECVWPHSCNLNIKIVADRVLALLNKIRSQDDRVFKVVVEEYPNQFSQWQCDESEEKRKSWETWFKSFCNPEIADAVVVPGEAGSLGHHEPQVEAGAAFALTITVDLTGRPQRQKLNVLVTLGQARVAYNLAGRVGTLTLLLSEAESSSISVAPQASMKSKFESRDVLWTPARGTTVDGLLINLHILGSYVRESFHLFSLSTADVKRIEHVRVTPAWAQHQASIQGAIPVVLLDRSAYTSHPLGRGFSCSIKAAFMSAVGLHLADMAGTDTARRADLIAKLEAFLHDDRQSEIKFFKDMLVPLDGIAYLDKVALEGEGLGGTERFEKQFAMQNNCVRVTADAPQQDVSKAMNDFAEEMAKRGNLWKDHIPQYANQDDVRSELASSEPRYNAPFRRHTMTYAFAYSLQEAAFESPSPRSGFTLKGLPLSFLNRQEASKTVEVVFGEDSL